MQYTKQEIETIGTAMCLAATYIDLAHDNLEAFWQRYFENTDAQSRAAFVLEAQHCPEFIGNQIFGVMHLLYEAKKEVDSFVNPNSSVVHAFLADAKEKQAIIDAQKETEG